MRSNIQVETELIPIHTNQNIKSEAAKLLDSSTASVSAQGANPEPRCNSEEIPLLPKDERTEWHYLLLKNKELLLFNKLLSEKQFHTFIYTAVEHRKRIEHCRYDEDEYQKRKETLTQNTYEQSSKPISGGGYLFVMAPLDQLTHALSLIQPRRYLVTDCATGKAARIRNKQMHDFISMYEMMPWNMRIMERPISDYANTHQLIRITGGILKGAEGFIVRVNRDRHLLFAFGSMTLAISGIHAFPFEPVEK